MEYIRNIAPNNYQRGPTRWAQPTWARPDGLCPPRPTSSGAHLLVYKSILPRKYKEKAFEMERRRLEAELGQELFCPSMERFRRGNFPPGGGNHCHHHHQQLSHLGKGISINIFNSTISSQTLVHLLYSILLPEL